MARAAIPNYLGNDFGQATPALRFGLLLGIWNEHNNWHKEVPVAQGTWQQMTQLTPTDLQNNQALRDRQKALAAQYPAGHRLVMHATNVAPLATGLGNEHPLENGFAFLNPYGLPYLPGSGVKGVLRQAARELASDDWGNQSDWNNLPQYRCKNIHLTAMDVLFGYESGETDHIRGVLSFWDVIPNIQCDRLSVEIMTPHQSHYYQNSQALGSANPHESGQPTPISYLSIPPKSGFSFYVVCDVRRLELIAPDLLQDGKWKNLLNAAFRHAFKWLGFGAKTSVGYGMMKEDENAAEAVAVAEAEINISENVKLIKALEKRIPEKQINGAGHSLNKEFKELIEKARKHPDEWPDADKKLLRDIAERAFIQLKIQPRGANGYRRLLDALYPIAPIQPQ